ncbi:Hypothetical predicted protein [Lecanosticta acicola]|uniref:Uncharacterized protein n=1 Tax=Lecanosticta acicola TaxID=111012 RepID=A0AAI8Z570_9PEZI|nr:Hypothetical predicted protein [Lecanosticta acicola]
MLPPPLDDSGRRNDYFTINPPAYTHYSTETPCCSPNFSPVCESSAYPEHPLLAYCEVESPVYEPTLPEMASSLMSMQTSAAHGHSNRPRPHPVQNVLHVTSDDSTSSSSSSSKSSSIDSNMSSPEFARCSRCQRTPSIDVKTGGSNMVPYGLNLWYCLRCAHLVGFDKR